MPERHRYAIYAEDDSDQETIKEIVHRLTGDRSLTIRGGGFGSGSELLKGCGRIIATQYRSAGFTRFIICHDADSIESEKIESVRAEVELRIVRASGVPFDRCGIVVPVQEIEAWILADIAQAGPKLFRSWKPKEQPHPEAIDSPKEYLEKLSRDEKSQPRYRHAVHNPRIAQHLDLEVVARTCKSFSALRDFVSAP